MGQRRGRDWPRIELDTQGSELAEVGPVLVPDVLAAQALRRGRATAVRCDADQVTFEELDARVELLARALIASTEPGARVAILAENCVAYVECYYAVPRAGRVLVPLNYRLAAPELRELLLQSQPSILIAGPGHVQTAFDVARALPYRIRLVSLSPEREADDLYDDLVSSGGALPTAPRADAADPAWLVYTSGTTGLPKGVVLTHENIVFGVLNSALAWGLEAPGSLLFPWPMFHVAGYAILAAHLEGSAVHLMRRFRADVALEAIAEHRITAMTIAPTMLDTMLDAVGDDGSALSSLRTVYYGSAWMPVEILRRAMELLPEARFRTGFGMTELSGLAVYLSEHDHREAAFGRPSLLGSVGRVMPLTQVRIVDEADDDVPQGAVGEIAVAGSQVAAGCWDGAGPSAVVRPGSWLRTGDLGRLDADGYLYVVDRLKDMIITGGENVYSLEVETALSSHPGVAMVAVFGVSDTHWGEVVVAAVRRSAAGSTDEEELTAYARTLLAGYKIPRRIYFVEDFPTNPSGKVLKRELRRRYEAEASARGDLP